MKFLRATYHFLGGVYFALMLIGTVAIFVIAGTFLESATQSHRYAALFTYGNPFFGFLLWGFFINILFAATRRWPFQGKHFPFLTVHLGLLMILGGVLLKHYFGLQGTMLIMEGSGSHQVIEPNTYAVTVEGRNGNSPEYFPLDTHWSGAFKSVIAQRGEGLHLRLAGYQPHSSEWLASWVKGNVANISGLNPMPMAIVEDGMPIVPAGRVRFYQDAPVWDVYSLKTDAIDKMIARLYQERARLRITHRPSGDIWHEASLSSDEIKFKDGSIGRTLLTFPCNPESGCVDALLTLAINGKESVSVPLQGECALQNLNLATPYLGSHPLAVDIVNTPFLAVIENTAHTVFLAAVDPHGHLWMQPFKKGNFDSIIVYDDGFAGYGIATTLPFHVFPAGRKERETALADQIVGQLRHPEAEHGELAPPLQLFKSACQEVDADFPEALTKFFVLWDNTHSWLFPEHQTLPPPLDAIFTKLRWESVPSHDWRACQWCQRLFAEIGPALEQGNPPLSVLRDARWPLLAQLEQKKLEDRDLLTLLTQQVFSAAGTLPAPENDSVHDENAVLLSAYLRAYGIHLSTIKGTPTEDEMQSLLTSGNHAADPIALETALVAMHDPLPTGKKLEDNLPMITLHASNGQRRQSMTLSYDRMGTGLKWPVLNGEYLVRFQPMVHEIPYHLRLRQARQVNYANSQQAFSYECDLIIADHSSGSTIEKTISMNNVHETWDGYRFYLSSIAPPNDSAVKRIQIVVNRDPAKYWLTYPGAIVLSCGIVLLFALRPYKRDE